MEPSTKLFPAVFAKATSPNVFQFELGQMKVSRTQPCGSRFAGLKKKKHTHTILSCILCMEAVGISLCCVFFFNYYFCCHVCRTWCLFQLVCLRVRGKTRLLSVLRGCMYSFLPLYHGVVYPTISSRYIFAFLSSLPSGVVITGIVANFNLIKLSHYP